MLCLLIAAIPGFAHHSAAAEFDSSKPVTLTGTVIRLDWENPHAHLTITAKDDGIWDFELGSPNALMHHGWNRSSVRPGDLVTVMGYRAIDGAKLANVRSVTLADGRRLMGGDSTPIR